jgi:hypothetical protein
MDELERQEWERQCLQRTRETLKAFGDAGVLTDEIQDVRLEGAYPDTELVVDFITRWGRPGALRAALWGSTFEARFGGRDDPDAVAGLIFANVDDTPLCSVIERSTGRRTWRI